MGTVTTVGLDIAKSVFQVHGISATREVLVRRRLSRARAGAAEGQLTMMIGGTDEDFADARPVIDAMAGKAVHVGPSGAGNVAKLINNMLVAAHMVTTGEARRVEPCFPQFLQPGCRRPAKIGSLAIAAQGDVHGRVGILEPGEGGAEHRPATLVQLSFARWIDARGQGGSAIGGRLKSSLTTEPGPAATC